MNLRRIFDRIKRYIKMADPNTGNVIYGDIYELNHIQTVKYPAVVVTCDRHNGNTDEGWFSFRLNIFITDRLLDDESNRMDIHSHSISILNTVVKMLDDSGDLILNSWEIHVFNERFNDLCAGAYMNLNLRVPISECFETVVDAVDGDICEP